MRAFRAYLADESGMSVVEYALLLAILSIAALVAYEDLTSDIEEFFKAFKDKFADADPDG